MVCMRLFPGSFGSCEFLLRNLLHPRIGDPRRWSIRKLQKWYSGAWEFGMRGKQVEYDFLGVSEVVRQGRKYYYIRGCVIRGRGVWKMAQLEPKFGRAGDLSTVGTRLHFCSFEACELVLQNLLHPRTGYPRTGYPRKG